jgi:hypothetical protein
MTAEIVPLPAKDLGNIPERLRDLASRLEAGEESAGTLFVIIPVAGDWPRLFGWGDVDGRNDPMIQLELCRHWLVENMVDR